MRALRSAYGSSASGSCAGCGAGRLPSATTASAARPSPWRVRRSWSPISAPRQAQAAPGSTLCRLLRLQRLRQRVHRLREVAAGVRDHYRRALVDTDRDVSVRRQLEADLDLQRSLDLALRQPDLAVRPVE